MAASGGDCAADISGEANDTEEAPTLGDGAQQVVGGAEACDEDQDRQNGEEELAAIERDAGMRRQADCEPRSQQCNGYGCDDDDCAVGVPAPLLPDECEGELGGEAGLHNNVEEKEKVVEPAVLRDADVVEGNVEQDRTHQVEADEVGEQGKAAGDAATEECDEERDLEDQAQAPDPRRYGGVRRLRQVLRELVHVKSMCRFLLGRTPF